MECASRCPVAGRVAAYSWEGKEIAAAETLVQLIKQASGPQWKKEWGQSHSSSK